MQAIGLIETRGLIPAIESADVMLKTSQVELIEKTIVGGGLVTVTVSGDVGAVKAAVDAGEAAVLAFGQDHLVSRHVIARPHTEIGNVLFADKHTEESAEVIQDVTEDRDPEESETDLSAVEIVAPIETEVPVAAGSDDYSDEQLSKLTISELRKLAEETTELKLPAKTIQKANRATLIKRLKEVRKEQTDKKQ
ncbi:BMC domain-containing protein [Candidatus Enterococcus clewellii]|uniref:BMC domain-containing protein n=1 Tax=Candidatus Enterococcus clewellii TaxID=1834193 RepID=A0A242KBZ7_9ENTE|nr:hypothetical protein A5888_000508 [Enterococcus sp. 9E7_DIV0242]